MVLNQARVAAAASSVHRSGIAAAAARVSCVERLAQFFPEASPLRLPLRITAEAGLSEHTVAEYGTGSEILFASVLPLEFGDRLRLRNADGSLEAEAVVVALHFRDGQTAVAARFAQTVTNWIVKT